MTSHSAKLSTVEIPLLSLVLPCYNESKSLPFILQRLSNVLNREDIEVILVDNGSTDDTAQVLQSILVDYPFAKALSISKNEGYGHGLYSGLSIATGRFLAWCHADLQTDPNDVLTGLQILEACDDPPHTFVKGLRHGRPWSDQLFTLGMSLFDSVVLLSPLWDINAQPNILPRELFEKYNDPPKDFSFDLFYYVLARRNRFKIYRFDVVFPDRRYGQSSWNINWNAKVNFIRRTVDFTFDLRRKLRRDVLR